MAADLQALIANARVMIDNYLHGQDGPDVLHQAHDSLTTALAALRAEAGAMGWMPIDSAPRDGTAVLLARGELVTYGHWAEPSTAGRPVHDRSGHVVDIEYDDWEALWVSWDCSITEDSPPTHWSPLPKGPEVVGKWRCQSCYQLFQRGQHKECALAQARRNDRE